MSNENTQSLGKWKCVETGEVDGVTNGFSPTIGPCQTIPLDDTAKKIAGVYEVPKKDVPVIEDAEIVENEDPDPQF
jgi:hypothetical protein